MVSFSILKKPFGVIILFQETPNISEMQRLDEWFSNPESTKMPVYMDLGKLETIDAQLFDYITGQLKRLTVLGVPSILVRENPDLREAFRKANWDRPIMILDYLDEAVFPKETKIPSSIKEKKSRPKESTCPKCSKDIRPGANRCLHCGQMIIQRRHERREISIPFLYGRVSNREFLNSSWLGGITEDLDMDSFSGVGFFSPRDIPRGAEIHIIFPTLSLQKNQKVKKNDKLTIFTGRVKHTTRAEPWYRIGVALFDMYEYTGRFDVKTEVQGDARVV